jgi:hypothetical protein
MSVKWLWYSFLSVILTLNFQKHLFHILLKAFITLIYADFWVWKVENEKDNMENEIKKLKYENNSLWMVLNQ